MYRDVATGLAILVALAAQPLWAEGSAATRTITLEHSRMQDAATVVRTIAGIRQLTADGDRLEISGAEAALRLATELLSALDRPEAEPSRGFATGDESVVAVIPLRHLSPADAMATVRELQLQRVATVAEPAVMVIRDTAEKVDQAVAALDEAASRSGR